MNISVSDFEWRVSLDDGTPQSCGFHVHYDGQETAVLFLTTADVSQRQRVAVKPNFVS
jgi:hypothetical protein